MNSASPYEAGTRSRQFAAPDKFKFNVLTSAEQVDGDNDDQENGDPYRVVHFLRPYRERRVNFMPVLPLRQSKTYQKWISTADALNSAGRTMIQLSPTDNRSVSTYRMTRIGQSDVQYIHPRVKPQAGSTNRSANII